MDPSAYREGHPVHVVIATHRGASTFRRVRLASAIFEHINTAPETLAACLMPDHLHWILRDAAQMRETVRRFKSCSTRTAWDLGHEGKLWQRSYWDHVIRRSEDLFRLCGYVVDNPVRAGLVHERSDYRFQTLKL